MAGICFFFEQNDVDVWSGRRIDLDAWNYALKAGTGIDKIIVVNRTDLHIETLDADLDFTVVPSLPESFEGRVANMVVPTNDVEKVELWNFRHDVDWYLFGPAGVSADYQMKSDDVAVTIPSSVDLHAIHAATVVMCHRHAVLTGRL